MITAVRTLAPLAAAALLLLACASCGGKVPPTTVWSLPVPTEAAPGVHPGGPALGVGRFTADPSLRTTALSGQGVVNPSAVRRWRWRP